MTITGNATVRFPPEGRTGAAQPTPAAPGGHTPLPAAAAPNGKNHSPIVFYLSVLLIINPVSVVQDCRSTVYFYYSTRSCY
jgi:hypothetical protein